MAAALSGLPAQAGDTSPRQDPHGSAGTGSSADLCSANQAGLDRGNSGL